jgi:hypothetical protein
MTDPNKTTRANFKRQVIDAITERRPELDRSKLEVLHDSLVGKPTYEAVAILIDYCCTEVLMYELNRLAWKP